MKRIFFCLLPLLILSWSSLGVFIACRCTRIEDTHNIAAAEWDRNIEVLERAVSGGPLRGDEFGQACLFFEELTSIRVHGEGTTVGYLITAETEGDLKKLGQWYSENKGLLIFNEKTGRIELMSSPAPGGR